MKCTACLLFAAILWSSAAVAEEEQDDHWFDLQGCSICKNLSEEKGMLEAITWENHLIDNGMLTISVVPESYKEPMERAKKGMLGAIKKLESGESMKLCQFCQSYGELLSSGAQMQELKTAGGEIQLITSENPGVVKKIHAHAKKTIAAMKAMESDHPHDHDEHHEKSASAK